MEPVASRWRAAHGGPPTDHDVDTLYKRFLPLQVETVEQHSDVIAGVVETVATLRARGLAVASTTGYPPRGHGRRRASCQGAGLRG